MWSRELFGELSADALPVEVEDLVDGARRRPQALLELGLRTPALHVARLLGEGEIGSIGLMINCC